MKLDAEHAAVLHGGGERAVVVGGGDLRGDAACGVRVHEVEGLVLHAFEERTARGDAVPADLRDWERAFHATYVPAHQTESMRDTHLVRGVEEQLVADADAEQRRAVRHRGAYRVIQRGVAKPRACGGEGAHAGKDDLFSLRDDRGVAG